ncbi:PIN domain-containing protein [Candidatus Pacearchaeota archaeon]|nr:PIN domain-containing protein [Candidatus Pacearchaeota archaeon]
MKCIIDAWAWVEYLEGTVYGTKVKEILENNEIYTSVITITEVISKVKRINKDVEVAYKAITTHSKIIPIHNDIAKDAGLFHADVYKKINDMGMADCILLITARRINAKIVTGDRHFKNFKEAILIR